MAVRKLWKTVVQLFSKSKSEECNTEAGTMEVSCLKYGVQGLNADCSYVKSQCIKLSECECLYTFASDVCKEDFHNSEEMKVFVVQHSQEIVGGTDFSVHAEESV
ncbi:U9 [Human betaherpesvirus 6B]|uniref:Protein U9 n=4 Tax=Roseolovirus TaxID=40272 RepID=VU9_HHV6Z|nr:hypothetical protein HhV6Bgp015 [Human betaherpesvirus 6B]Q9WT55.1 RecName: Full=Protein U9 [Human herpesvirus 6 strain Z29]ARJ98807.1 U9 [Human betaherpesvirus 6]AAD49626.1 U9 [Human betaherpesvirus 6B]ARJ98914.1 U9 [Human betaherpesvirus 6]ARJ99026.1 U9 [Human betaherpesvirus 6]ARJ99135.1 U9 [Human betaherpesvirus 6]